VGADAVAEACDGVAECREEGAPEASLELGVDAGVGGLEDAPAAVFSIGDGGGGVKWWWWSMGGEEWIWGSGGRGSTTGWGRG